MVDIIEDGLLCEITADHDFSKVVRRKVFVGTNDRLRLDNWADQFIADMIEADKKADPSFDAYGYSVLVWQIEVRSDY